MQSGTQATAIKILQDISKSKGSQKMEFCQLIEYNMKNIFLQQSCMQVVSTVIS